MALHLIEQYQNLENLMEERYIPVERVFLDRSNPMELYDDVGLYRRFRFNREGITWLVDVLLPELMRPTARSKPIPPVIQICITLRFYATGTFQICMGDRFGVAQSSVSRIITEVTKSIKRLANNYIKYPVTEQDINAAKRGFFELGGMPNIIGAIDGSHVCIQAPYIDEFAYVNRKNYHSINVQGIGNADGIFINIIAKWPGSVHDARMFTESKIYEDLEANRKTGMLLGDAGYMSKRYLLTPYDRPTTPAAQIRYNTIHSRHRVKIEQLFGRWKRRFHCLHTELRVTPEKACEIIVACAVLHNEATKRNMGDFEDNLVDNQPAIQPYPGNNNTGNDIRNYYANYLNTIAQ